MPSDPTPRFVVRPPGREPYIVTLDQLTAHVRAARTLRTMNFLDKMKQASTVAAGLEMRAEADADALIARGAELDGKRVEAFGVHTKRMDANHDALDRLEHAFDYLGNGAPPAGSDVGKVASETKSAQVATETVSTDGNAYVGTSPPKI